MNSPRQAKTKRRTTPGKIIIQERDKQILSLLVKYRFLTTSQLHNMCFGARSKALRRLRQLFDANLVNRLFRPVIVGNAEIIYTIAPKGFALLKSFDPIFDTQTVISVNGQRTQLFLEHELALVEFRLAVEKSCELNNIEMLFWKFTPELRLKASGRLGAERIKCLDGSTLPLLPDSFFGLVTSKGKSYFFVEMDRGTESLKRIAVKLKAYVNYLRTGQYQNRWGYKAFRVLIITTSDRRVNNMLKLAQTFKGFEKLFWFTTLDNARDHDNIFATSWICAADDLPNALVDLSKKSENENG